MSILKKLWNWIMSLFGKGKPSWEDCTKASCWNGNNASQRMMNVLSPKMPQSVFDDYVNFMKDRGCDHAHVILFNKADGPPYAGYSPYGPDFGATLDGATVELMLERIETLREEIGGVVIWLLTDDSSGYAKAMRTRFSTVIPELKEAGLFDEASYVVPMLESLEGGSYPGWTANDFGKLVECLRDVTELPIGIHQNADQTHLAGFGDLFLWQTNPGKSPAQIASMVKQVVAKTGKPVCAFEMERSPARELCESALQAGAWSVGNW